MAKAYPDIRVSSQLDLDLHDDLSDVESLDSFFDDDFDTEQKDEKLQNLLSCNTLGVESKVGEHILPHHTALCSSVICNYLCRC